MKTFILCVTLVHVSLGYSVLEEPIDIDIRTFRSDVTFSFGGHVWHSSTDRYNDVIDALGDAFKIVRWQVIPRCDASRCPGEAPTGNYTDEQMDGYVADAYEEEMFIEAIQTMYGYMQERGVEVLGMTWSAPTEYLEYRDGGQALNPNNIEDYARFLTSSVQYLANHGVHIMYLEMSNEPDGFWDTRIEPVDYTVLAYNCRTRLDAAGFNSVGILGPGVSSLQPNTWDYYDALAQNPDGLNSLAGFSTHIWDDAYKEDDPIYHVNYWMNNTLTIMRTVDADKPIFTTEFGYNANSLNGRQFVGTWDECYDSIYTDEIKNTHMSQSPMYASRMYGMLLLQLHYAVSGSLVWEMGDEGWNYMCWGITDRAARPKQAMASLRSIVSHIGSDAHPVSTTFDTSNCVVGVVYNSIEERTVIGISNLLRLDSDTACRKLLPINGVKTDEITSVEVHTYNNGTVSFNPVEQYMSLVHYDGNVDYDLDEDELIMFLNVTLEPHSIATLIIDGRVRNESVGCIGPCADPDGSGNCPYYFDPEYPGCCEGWQLAYWAPDEYWYCYQSTLV